MLSTRKSRQNSRCKWTFKDLSITSSRFSILVAITSCECFHSRFVTTVASNSYLLRFISLVQSQHGYVLQFYEKRSLKNLIHLFLRVQEAPPAIVIYHLSLSLSHLKDQVSTANNQTKFLENEVNKRDFHVQELQKEVEALKAKVAENENMILHRNTEEVKRLNREIKSIETAKEFEENRLKTLVKTFEAKVDQLQQENFMANEKLLWVSSDGSSRRPSSDCR